MNLCTTLRIRGLQGARSEQRVREADSIVLDLDDVGLDGGCEPGRSADTGCGLRDRDSRVSVGGGCDEEVSARRR